MSKKFFLDRAKIVLGISIIMALVGAFIIASSNGAFIIASSNHAEWWVFLIIIGIFIIVSVVIIMLNMVFVAFSNEEIIIYDYRKFFKLKKSVISVAKEEKVLIEIDYNKHFGYIRVYYTSGNEKKELAISLEIPILKAMGEHIPKAKYKIICMTENKVCPESHEEYLKKLKYAKYINPYDSSNLHNL